MSLAGAGVIVGASVVAAGTRLTWIKATYGGRSVSTPGLPPVTIGGGEIRLDAGDVGAGYLFGLALLFALVPLGWLVVGPRARVALGVIGLAIAIGIGVGVAFARRDMGVYAAREGQVLVGENESAFYRTSSASGSGVTAAGAAVGGLCSIAGASAGARVPKMRMPEPPDKGAPA